MKIGIDAMLSHYDPKSYDLRGRVKILWYFFLIIIPVLMAFMAVMNILIPRGIFQALNVIIVVIMIILAVSWILVGKGLYNIAVTIMAFGVLAALIYNAKGTEATGSGQRFLVSQFSYMMPIFFALLFCRQWVLVAVAVIAEAAVLITVLTSSIVDPAVRYVIVASMSITNLISVILAMMMTRITDASKRLRAADASEERRLHREINEGLMASMRGVSSRLDDSSRDLSGDASHFAESIQSQAASIEEITATMEEISSGSEQVSAGAQRQSGLMDDLMKRMNDLVSLARDMESRIDAALSRTQAIAEKARAGESYIGLMDSSMGEIGLTSKEMTGILAIINDISDRINLLSLNAAIEAARAGDFGRGFAVVADEIAKLADQTSSSVKEIASLIVKSDNEIGKALGAVQDTVKVMREIIAGVEESNEVIAGVNEAMDMSIDSTGQAHGAVGAVKERAEEIATASIEQKTAAMDVMNTITEINQMSQTNAARAEDLNRHSRDIAAMAADLKGKISSYHDEDTEDAGA